MTDEEQRLDKEDMDILDDLYKAYDDGYQQGRADAIDECKALFRKYILTKEIEGLDELLEQLKEQK